MRKRFLPVVGVCLFGIMFGHGLAYLLAAPGLAERTRLLESTSHSYWDYASVLILLIAALAASILAGRHFQAGLSGKQAQPMEYGKLARRMSAIQAAGFSLLETGEFVGAGKSLLEAVSAPTFRFGLLVQVLVALGLALLIQLLARAATVLGRMLRRVPDRNGTTAHPAFRAATGSSRPLETMRPRGPPAAPVLSPAAH